jgi:hypothetical protein
MPWGADLPQGDRDDEREGGGRGEAVPERQPVETALARVRRLARDQGLAIPPEDPETPEARRARLRELKPYEERLNEIYRKEPGQEG